jgi:hypothetical protein
MVSCPWFPGIAAYAKEHPCFDWGLHLRAGVPWPCTHADKGDPGRTKNHYTFKAPTVYTLWYLLLVVLLFKINFIFYRPLAVAKKMVLVVEP